MALLRTDRHIPLALPILSGFYALSLSLLLQPLSACFFEHLKVVQSCTAQRIEVTECPHWLCYPHGLVEVNNVEHIVI